MPRHPFNQVEDEERTEHGDAMMALKSVLGTHPHCMDNWEVESGTEIKAAVLP